MTHSILKQFFFSRCYKSCYSDIFTCIFFIVSVCHNLFSTFQVYFIFYDMIMQYKKRKWMESQVVGISGYCYHKSQRFVAIFWSSGCISWWLKWIFIFFEVPLKRSEKKNFIHIWHVKSMRRINNKNRDRGGKCGIFFPFYSDPRFMFISLS